MIKKHIEQGGWYGDCTIEGDYVSLHRDSHIIINGNRLELPGNKDNILFLVIKRWRDEILIAGQSHQGKGNYLYKNGKWNIVSTSFATFPCAFGTNSLYLLTGNNQYRIYDLATDTISEPISRQIGVNGIRYIDFSQSTDGIVTGDETYGPSPYNISQWTRAAKLIAGQSYYDGTIIQHNAVDRLIEHGDTQFIRFHFVGTLIAIAIVKMLENTTVFDWFDSSELTQFPIQVPPTEPPVDIPPVIPPTGDNMIPIAPNELATVEEQMRLHPEIDTMDEGERGKIVDYCCVDLNPEGHNKPWGRKARNSDGSNKNTDGLTFLRPDNRFEIYDVISGVDGSATWSYAGIFAQGENGFWAPHDPVDNVIDPPVDPPVDPDLPAPPSSDLEERVLALENAFKQLSDSAIQFGMKVAFKADAGFYLCAEAGGLDLSLTDAHVRMPGNVNATRKTIGGWEGFTIEKA